MHNLHRFIQFTLNFLHSVHFQTVFLASSSIIVRECNACLNFQLYQLADYIFVKYLKNFNSFKCVQIHKKIMKIIYLKDLLMAICLKVNCLACPQSQTITSLTNIYFSWNSHNLHKYSNWKIFSIHFTKLIHQISKYDF